MDTNLISDARGKHSPIGMSVRILIYSLIVIMPIMYGGVTSASRLLFGVTMTIATGIMLAGLWKKYCSSGEQPSRSLSITGIEWFFVGALGLCLFQCLPFPQSLLTIVSPDLGALQVEASDVISDALSVQDYQLFSPQNLPPVIEEYPVAFSLSVDRYKTIMGMFTFLGYFLFYMIIIHYFRRIQTIITAFHIFAFTGVFVSLYGFLELLTEHKYILSLPAPLMNRLSGTFVNPNHAAAWFEIAFFSSLGLLLYYGKPMQLTRARFLRSLLRQFSLANQKKVSLMMLCLVINACGLMFTLSRSGITVTVLGCLFLFLYYHLRLSDWKMNVVFITLTFLSLYWTGMAGVEERFEKIYDASTDRFDIWQDTVTMFSHSPLFGTGFNTYEDVFSLYKSKEMATTPVHAHNDYLEVLSESGVIGFGLLIAFCAIQVLKIRGQLQKMPEEFAMLFATALTILISLSLHAITEFIFHIPALMMSGIFFLASTNIFTSHLFRYRLRVKRKRRLEQVINENTEIPQDFLTDIEPKLGEL